ncbi:MAG TPA: YfiR family protein [Cyclobacteriaceae bacterium]|nr:YfiR family protein [Cyclobacteriaceae bacterium]
MAFRKQLMFLKNPISAYLLLVLLPLPAVTRPQAQSTSEYQIKAVFLFNFTQFVEWPESSFQSAQSPMIIGILGHDPFGSYLDEAIKNEKVKDHPITVKRISDVGQAKDCHMLFINMPNPGRLKETLASVKGKNILTIGDTHHFAKSGGVIRFYTDNNKIRIRINLQAAKENGLIISSKLLRLADIVETGKS